MELEAGTRDVHWFNQAVLLGACHGTLDASQVRQELADQEPFSLVLGEISSSCAAEVASDWHWELAGSLKTPQEVRRGGELMTEHAAQWTSEENPVCSPFFVLIQNGLLGIPEVISGTFSHDIGSRPNWD